MAKYDPKTDYASEIKYLLNSNSLNNNQRAGLHNDLSAYLFQQNQMPEYLETDGHSLFLQ